MISPTNHAAQAQRLEANTMTSREKLRRPSQDQLSTESATFLKAELGRQPEIRPEAVARGRDLAADPSYPGPAVIRRIAQQLLAAPDLSEQD